MKRLHARSSTSVLLVAHQYWPTPGAATQVLNALVVELMAKGAQVDVITCRPRPGTALVEVGPNGERIHYGAGPEGGGTGLRRIIGLLEFALGVLRIGWRLEYSVVVTDPPPTAAWAALVLAKRRSAPLTYYLADSWAGASQGSRALLVRIAHPALRWLEYGALRRAHNVVAVTGRMHDVARSAGARQIQLAPNGVPLHVFRPEGPRWTPNDKGRPFFLYAGNAGVVHGAEVFAQAAEVMWRAGRDFDVVYMGYGGDVPLVENVRARWPDRVWVLPNQPPDIVSAAMRGAVGALSSLRPSRAYDDARPVKTLTGLACGTPAIYAGDGDFARVLSRERLGFVTTWSVAGAVASMDAALHQCEALPKAAADLSVRCVAYARACLDERVSARTAAACVLATKTGDGSGDGHR